MGTDVGIRIPLTKNRSKRHHTLYCYRFVKSPLHLVFTLRIVLEVRGEHRLAVLIMEVDFENNNDAGHTYQIF